MKISELKSAIREMIVSELTENDQLLTQKPGVDSRNELPDLIVLNKAQSQSPAVRAKYKPVTENESLNELAKIVGDLKTAIEKVIDQNKDAEMTDLRKAVRSDADVKAALAKDPDGSALQQTQLDRFILKTKGELIPQQRGRKADPNKPAKEPKEPGKRGPKKGSKRSSDAIAFTMGGDVSISGKNVSPAEKRKAVKSAQKGKPVELLKIRDLEAIDKEIVDLSQELKSKLTKTKEIAAKGNLKDYTPEETAFMDDVKSKSIRISQLKATKEKILDKTVKRQDRNIDMANVDLD
jgi:hypothetical protein